MLHVATVDLDDGIVLLAPAPKAWGLETLDGPGFLRPPSRLHQGWSAVVRGETRFSLLNTFFSMFAEQPPEGANPIPYLMSRRIAARAFHQEVALVG